MMARCGYALLVNSDHRPIRFQAMIRRIGICGQRKARRAQLAKMGRLVPTVRDPIFKSSRQVEFGRSPREPPWSRLRSLVLAVAVVRDERLHIQALQLEPVEPEVAVVV